MADFKVPFNRPTTAARTMEYLNNVLNSGHLAGDGSFSRSCEQLLEQCLTAEKAFLTPSCTAALEMAALLLNVGQDDEVIVPSYTFPSTALPFALRGAKIVFADCRADTLNVDEATIASLINERTRVICVMHYAGIACEMNGISRLAAEQHAVIVEDNAHGIGGSYLGKALGSFGALAVQSFHETKNLSCGEGGALIVNEPRLIERAEIIREKGTNRAQFWRGQVDKYTWVDAGSSFLLSEIAAAALLAQLEEIGSIQGRRRELWERYMRGLEDVAPSLNARLPAILKGAEPAYHLMYLMLESPSDRKNLQDYLLSRGILAVTHYVPLHSSPYGRQVGAGDCPVAEDVADRLLRLPLFTDMTDWELQYVIEEITHYSCET